MRLARGETEEGLIALFTDPTLKNLLAKKKVKLLLNPQALQQKIIEVTGNTPHRHWATFVAALGEPTLVPLSIGELQNVVGLGIDERVGEGNLNYLPIAKDEAPLTGNELLLVLGKLGTLQQLWEKEEVKIDSTAKVYLSHITQQLSLSELSRGRELALQPVDIDGVKGEAYLFFDQGSQCNLPIKKVVRYGSRQGKVTCSRKDRVLGGIFLPASTLLGDPLAQQRELDLASRFLGTPDARVELGILNEEQFAIWMKYGFFGELSAYREGAVSLKKVLSLLEKNLPTSIQIQIQRATSGKIDLIFAPREKQFPGEIITFSILGIENGKPKWVNNVAGVVCVEPELTDRQRKELSARLRGGLRLVTNNKDKKLVNILTINSDLLHLWQQELNEQRPIYRETQPPLKESLPLPEATQSSVVRVAFETFEATTGIGARFMQLVVVYGDGQEERLTLDMGAQYDDFPWDGLTKPSFAMGITPFSNHLPYIPRFVKRGLLLKEAEAYGKSFLGDIKNPYLHDLWEWLGEEAFTKLVADYANNLDAADISRYLASLPSTKNVHHLGVLVSHAHADHTGWQGIPTSRIPWIFASEGWPFVETQFLSGSGWLTEGPLRRDRKTWLNPAAKNEVYSPPILNPEPYQEVLLGRGQIGVTMLPLPHSIYGAVSYVIRVFDKVGSPVSSIAYTGDFNFDDPELVNETVSQMLKLGVDTIITDTTNLVASDKPSVRVTKEMMIEAFVHVIKNPSKRGMTAIGLNWNNVGDLALISEVTKSASRPLYIPPKAATTLHLFAELDHNRDPKETYFWRSHNPVPRLGVSALPYVPIKTVATKAERLLDLLYRISAPRELTSQGLRDAVVVVPTNPHLYATLAGIRDDGISDIVWSTYWPYSQTDQMIFRTNQRYAKEREIRWYGDYGLYRGRILPASKPTWHRSGHARKDELIILLRTLHEQGKLQTIIPIHGAHRGIAAKILKENLGSIKIISHIKKGELDEIILYQ